MSDGYVTNIAYVAEYYAYHSPIHMNLTCAYSGFRPRPLDGPFTWCDYGCGNGVTANALAACSPHCSVLRHRFYERSFSHGRNAVAAQR